MPEKYKKTKILTHEEPIKPLANAKALYLLSCYHKRLKNIIYQRKRADFMHIYTITLSPAYDIYCTCENLRIGCENILGNVEKYIGGKGINISRALANMGVFSTALCVLGRDNSDDFISSLSDTCIDTRFVFIDGRIRENITVRPSGDAHETRLCFDGAPLDGSVIERIEDEIFCEIREGDFVTFTGSVPSGVSRLAICDLLTRARDRGARLVIDSRSLTLDEVISLSPFLIKPNEHELHTMTSCDTSSLDAVLTCARGIVARGVRNVLVSLGERGAVLVTSDGAFTAVPPRIVARSTVGAGDSMIAGFLAAQKSGLSSGDALALAVAYGTAACMQEGTAPPTESDVSSILNNIYIINDGF